MNLRRCVRNVTIVLLLLLPPHVVGGEPRVVDLNVVGGRVEGPSTVRIRKGETVLLRWRVDKPMALHVHGYDLHADAKPDAPASLAFEGRYTGRFPVTLHGAKPRGSHQEPVLLYLEVYPE